MEYVQNIQKFRLSIPVERRPTWFKTTTINMTAKSGTTIDPDIMRNVFYKIGQIPVYFKGRKTPFMWRLFHSDFYNQVSIGYTDQLSTKKVKIFPNGSLQIAGCADIDDCKRFTQQLKYLLKLVYKIDISCDFTIVMYNGYFSLNNTVNVYNLIDTLNRKGIKFNYDPDRYAAVKVKFDKVTVSIFVSGSVLVTGTKSFQEALNVYKKIVTTVLDTPDVFMERNDMSSKFDTFLGYRIEQWVQKDVPTYGVVP